MALVVWLPLNGNLNNLGLSNITVTNNGATIDSNGKIGQCYVTGSNKYISCSNLTFNSPEWSITTWIYSDGSSYNGTVYIVSIHSANSSTDFYGGIQLNYSTSFMCRLAGTTYTFGTITTGAWHHLAVTYKNKTVCGYIDGVLASSFSTTTPTATATKLEIARRYGQTSYYFSGKINDVRVYDHCLSAREVKEISKALVAHYKLDATDRINPNLVAASEERRTPEGGTSSNEYGIVCNSLPIFDTYGIQTYTVSFDIKSAVEHSFSLYSTSGTGPKYTFPATTINVTTEWQRVTYTFTPTLNNSSGTWARITVYGIYGSGAIVSLRNVKLELGEVETPFGTDTGAIPDTSGYKHNGTIVGTLTASSDSPRYNSSLTFKNSNYAAIGRGGMVVDAITVSWWGKMSNWGSYGRAISCTEGGGWNFEPADSKLRFAINLNGTYVLASDTNTLSSLGSDWHHFAGTYDRTNVKFYRDGELITTTPAPSANVNIKYHASNGIFIGAEAAASAATGQSPYFPGKLSDIRIYAIALSAEDIYELYHTPAYIDNQGDMMEYEIYEDETTQPRILKIGEVKANKFKELNMYLYLPAGSYVNTGLNYDNGDECKAETVIKYSGGSGRDLMGYSSAGAGYWGVKAAGTWEPHGTFTYTNADISVPNFITYTFSSASEHGTYQIGRLASSYSVRNKYIYNVKLYKNGVLERNLYPDVQDSSAGLFDILNGVFYPAVGNPSVGIETDDNICRMFKNHIKSTYFEEI